MELDEAQRTLDEHLVLTSGRCASCGRPAPCPARREAAAVFARAGRLPLRRPEP